MLHRPLHTQFGVYGIVGIRASFKIRSLVFEMSFWPLKLIQSWVGFDFKLNVPFNL